MELDDDEDDDDDEGEGTGKKDLTSQLDGSFRQLLVEEEEKTTEDLDLLPFFQHWTVERRANFHARAPGSLPEALVSLLGRSGDASALTVQLILSGNWIPSYFPSTCPPDVSRWLYGIICFSDDEVLASAAWDAWTHYFGRGGMWDPDDASFGWFRDSAQKARVGLQWVPDWDIIVDTLEAFGAASKLYRKAIIYSDASSFPREWPAPVDRVSEPTPPAKALVDSFPVRSLHRFFSLVSLSLPGGVCNARKNAKERQTSF